LKKAETHMIFVSQLLEEDGSDGLDSPVGVAAGAFTRSVSAARIDVTRMAAVGAENREQ
jgi:hypothetical protein